MLKNSIKKLIGRSGLRLGHRTRALFQQYILFGNPGSNILKIGITGTDGKSTTIKILETIFDEAGYKVGVISTLGLRIGDEEQSNALHVTSPDSIDYFRCLRKAEKVGVEVLLIETTSHGLELSRFGNTKFDYSGITNITREHLDFHGTYENYVKAKFRLLEMTKSSGHSYINYDDVSYKPLIQLAKDRDLKNIRTYGSRESADLEIELKGDQDFQLSQKETEPKDFTISFHGAYNIYNSTLAIGIARDVGIDDNTIKAALTHIPQIRGRWEVLKEEPFKVVIDFAHTPNGLENVLEFANTQKQDKVTVVFGCASKRDTYKRPLMGEIADRLCDKVILTAEDPRGESVSKINQEIMKGIPDHKQKLNKTLHSIEDRREAIAYAIETAEKNELIIITGKGHEESMNLDGENEIPWNDVEITKDLIKYICN